MEETQLLFAIGFILLSIRQHVAASQPDLAWVHALNRQAEELAKAHQDEARQMVDTAMAGQDEAMRCPATKKLIQQAEHARDGALPFKDNASQKEARYPRLLVLVSFSMPMESLKALAAQVHKVGGQLVFRGLYNNSFKEMALKLKELGSEALIDPTVFTALNITQVPAFVHFEREPISALQLPPYDLLQGHVSLRFAFEKFRDKGEVEGVDELLTRLGRVSQ